MNIIGKKLATGALGTILAVVPVAKANAQKTAVSTAGKLHTSTMMASAGEKLTGLRTDIFDASKNVATNKLKAANTLTEALRESTGIKDATIIAETPKASIIDVTKESLTNSRILDVTKNQLSQFRSMLLSDSTIEHVKIAVPKNKRIFQAEDITFNCNYKTNNGKAKTNLLLKGDDALLIDSSQGLIGASANKQTVYSTGYYKLDEDNLSSKSIKKGIVKKQTTGLKNIAAKTEYKEIDKSGKSITITAAEFEAARRKMLAPFRDVIAGKTAGLN